MRPSARAAIAACFTLLLLAVSALPAFAAEETDPQGDIPEGTVDIVGWEAGILPADSDLVNDSDALTWVWVKVRTADGFTPSDDLFSWFASFSMFFPDPDDPARDIHLSMAIQRHDGQAATFPECPPDSASCPPDPFEVSTTVLDDGTLLMIACIPYEIDELSVRTRTGVLPTEDGTFTDDWGPDDMTAQPVDLTPRDPREPEPEPTTTTTTTQPTTTTTQPTTTTEAVTTTQGAEATGAEPEGDSEDEGLPGWLLIVLIVGGLALGGIGWWLLAARGDPCQEILEAWEKARKDCDELTEQAKRKRSEHEKAKEEVERAREQLDELCREWPAACADPEAYVELPGQPDSRIDDRERRLREMYAGDAWADYMANPSPETAKAAEEAWERATEGDLGEEMRRKDAEASARKQKLEDDISSGTERADQLDREASDAEAKAKDACDRADELRESYEKCVEEEEKKKKGQARAPAAAAPPPSTPEPTPAPEEPQPSAGAPPVPPPPARRGCEEGDTRWETFDGPHPFHTISESEMIRVTVTAVVGDGNFAMSIPWASPDGELTQDSFVSMTDDDWNGVADAVSDKFENTMAGRTQRLFISVVFDGYQVSVTCQKELRCVDGEWVDTGRRRCAKSDPIIEPSPAEPVNVQANIGGTVMSREEVRKLVRGTLSRVESQVRQRQEARDQIDELCRKCAAGERG